MPKGMWNVDGKLPNIDDKRVKFIKGKFQNTYSEIEKNINKKIFFYFILMLIYIVQLYFYLLN